MLGTGEKKTREKKKKRHRKTINGSAVRLCSQISGDFLYGTFTILVSSTLSRDSRLSRWLSSFWSFTMIPRDVISYLASSSAKKWPKHRQATALRHGPTRHRQMLCQTVHKSFFSIGYCHDLSTTTGKGESQDNRVFGLARGAHAARQRYEANAKL